MYSSQNYIFWMHHTWNPFFGSGQLWIFLDRYQKQLDSFYIFRIFSFIESGWPLVTGLVVTFRTI